MTIYGSDDRLDIYQLPDPKLKKLWESTVALVSRKHLQHNADGTYSFISNLPIWLTQNICAEFSSQPSPAFCSGFLVGEDLVATAGHCVTNAVERLAHRARLRRPGVPPPRSHLPAHRTGGLRLRHGAGGGGGHRAAGGLLPHGGLPLPGRLPPGGLVPLLALSLAPAEVAVRCRWEMVREGSIAQRTRGDDNLLSLDGRFGKMKKA